MTNITETSKPTGADRLLTVIETCRMLGFKSYKSIYKLCDRGDIQPVYIGGSAHRKFRLTDVQKLIRELPATHEDS